MRNDHQVTGVGHRFWTCTDGENGYVKLEYYVTVWTGTVFRNAAEDSLGLLILPPVDKLLAKTLLDEYRSIAHVRKGLSLLPRALKGMGEVLLPPGTFHGAL